MINKFKDRRDAGRQLARSLVRFRGQDAMVLALPRGGVPVAFEVAEELQLPLDVLMVRKLGVPGQPEFAFGAIAVGGVVIVNEAVIRSLRLADLVLDTVVEREKHELLRRERLYRAGLPPLDLRGRTAIIVDDGLATGSTMQAAISAARHLGAEEVVVAVPVCAPETHSQLVNESKVPTICVIEPEPFYAVGLWYQDFTQTTDEQVMDLLARARFSKGVLV